MRKLYGKKMVEVESEDEAFVKLLDNVGKLQFYVKANGPYLPNPYDPLYRQNKKKFKFKRVNKRIYDLYTRFLRTKIASYKNQAEREL